MEKLVTLKEAAKKLGVSYVTLFRIIKSNYQAPGIYKLGKTYKLDLKIFKTGLASETEPKKVKFGKLRYYYEHECYYYNTLNNQTIKSHKKALMVASEFFCSNEFTKENLYKFKDYLLKEKNLKESTVKKYFAALSKMCGLCVNAGIIKENICIGLQQGLRVNQVERFLTIEERERIRSIANKEILDHIEFAIETGLKKGEQVNLTWDKVDLEKSEIHIMDRKNGKNKVIPVSNMGINILKGRQNYNKPFREIHHYEFQKILNAAGIENFRWQDLRHTFAKWCIKGWHNWLNNTPLSLDKIQKLLGYTKIITTERYNYLDASELKSIFNNSS